MHIGEKIQYRRKELGLTQEELCKGICSITYLSKLENNKLETKEDLLILLCERLGLKVDDLLKNEYSDYMSKLRYLYKLVSDRDVNKLKLKIDELYSVQNLNNPILITAFDIILLEFYIINKNRKMSLDLKQAIIEKKDYLNDETRVWFYKVLGHYEFTFGDIIKSSDHFYKAKDLVDSSRQTHAHLEYLLGLVNTRLMLISRAILHTEKALEIYNAEINFNKIIDCKLLLGINYGNIGHYQMANKYYLNIVDALSSTNNKRMLGKVYHNLGYLNSENQDHQKAIYYYNKALEFKNNPIEKLSTIYLLSYEYKNQGNIDKAVNLCQYGLDIGKSKNIPFYYKIYILNQSMITDGFYQESFIEKLENEIIPFFLEQDPSSASECFDLLANIFANKKQYKRATFYYKKAIELQKTNKQKEILF